MVKRAFPGQMHAIRGQQNILQICPRPTAILTYTHPATGTTISQTDTHINPVHVKTDANGKALVGYIPPKYRGANNINHFIAGYDIINAT